MRWNPPASLAVLFVLSGPLPSQETWQPFPGTIAITHVDVLTMEREGLLPDQTVVVVDGRIAALGPAALVAAPAGARTVDGRGLTLLPGLCDMHVHLNDTESDQSLWLYLAHGVTTVQSMHATPRHLPLRRRLARGELPGPRMFTTGPTTAMEQVNSPERAEDVVRAQKALGYDAIKMYGDGRDHMTRATYAHLIGAAHAAGLRVVGHAPRNLPFAAVLDEGQDSIDHMEEIIYTEPTLQRHLKPLTDLQFRRGGTAPDAAAVARLVAAAAPEIESLAQRVKRAGLVVTPTLICFHTIVQHTNAEFDTLGDHPLMRCMSPLTRRTWEPERNRYRQSWKGRFESVGAALTASFQVQQQLVKAFHASGVPLMAGSDAPLMFVFPGWSLHRELQLLVACGLPPFAALRAATVTPARVLGSSDHIGTVAVGKDADLLLVCGDPLRDIRATAAVAGVCVRGRWLDRGELDRGLAALAQGHEQQGKDLAQLVGPLDRGDALAAGAAFQKLAHPDPALAAYFENELNERGYGLLRQDRIDEAIAILELNTRLFAASFNAWDSLGEAWLQKGDKDQAARFYRRSLELNPHSASGLEAVRKLEAESPRKQ